MPGYAERLGLLGKREVDIASAPGMASSRAVARAYVGRER
jgi:hypothetical protein